MKLTTALTTLLVSTSSAIAGSYEVAQGLEDPPVMEPARPSGWGGFYAGVAVGRVTDNVRTFDCSWHRDWTGWCDPRVPAALLGNPDIQALPEGFSMPTQLTHNSIGGFAGYRHQFNNRLVVGGELGFGNIKKSQIEHTDSGTIPCTRMSDTIMVDGSYRYGEIQAGYDMDRFLPYASVGMLDIHDYSAPYVGGGIDVKIGKRLLLGVKYQHMISDEHEANILTARIGWRF